MSVEGSSPTSPASGVTQLGSSVTTSLETRQGNPSEIVPESMPGLSALQISASIQITTESIDSATFPRQGLAQTSKFFKDLCNHCHEHGHHVHPQSTLSTPEESDQFNDHDTLHTKTAVPVLTSAPSFPPLYLRTECSLRWHYP